MPLVSAKLKLDFLRRQVLMSRNISGGSLISVFMGGLNYQIEHHLFPSMARPYLRKAQPLVSAYCAAQGVPYTRTTLWQSYRIVIGYLNSVGLRGKDPFLCPWSLNAAPSNPVCRWLRSLKWIHPARRTDHRTSIRFRYRHHLRPVGAVLTAGGDRDSPCGLVGVLAGRLSGRQRASSPRQSQPT